MNDLDIYKFLDEYLGDQVRGVRIKTNREDVRNVYNFISANNGVVIFTMFHNFKENKYVIYRSESLCNIVESFLNLEPEIVHIKIRDWFGDRFKIEKFDDLMKFV